MSEKHFSIIFCGGCNPKIDRSLIAKTLSDQLGKRGYRVSYNEVEADFIVYLSGCSVSCAERIKDAEVPFIEVAGSSIDSISFNEDALSTEILTGVRNYFEKF
jgi:hypothetical protein